MSNILDYPVYMHYFDRELRNSVKATLYDEYIIELTEMALLLTTNNLYVSNSLLWESISHFPNAVKYVVELEKYQEVILLSNYSTIDEFIISRRYLYLKDKDKYPMYFSDELNDKPWGKHIVMLKDSTTEVLEDKMKGKLSDEFNLISNGDFRILGKLDEIIKTALYNRDGQAITFSLFQQYINKDDKQKNELESMIRRMISLLYTRRYLNTLNGTIITGIQGLQSFDILGYDFVFFDYNIHKLIFKSIGALFQGKLTLEQRVMNVISMKRDSRYREFLIELRGFVQGIRNSIDSQKCEKNIERVKLFQEIRNVLNKSYANNSITNFSFSSVYLQLININSKMLQNRLFKEGYDEMKKLSECKKILIVTATLTELKILLRIVESKGIEPSRFTRGSHTYFNLGQLGKNDVYIIRTQMGSLGPSSSILSINEAVNTINPDYVIMAGIAFGLKKDKQKLGDILVSNQLWSYEQAKLTDNERFSRGDKITASGLLLDRFSTSSISWEKTKVEFGLIVSGEKLVNSEKFIDELIKCEPEAIGGEMEGTGLMSVCQNVKKEWIVVKSICDWGYKKSSQYQEAAATNVMEYVIDTITNYFD